MNKIDVVFLIRDLLDHQFAVREGLSAQLGTNAKLIRVLEAHPGLIKNQADKIDELKQFAKNKSTTFFSMSRKIDELTYELQITTENDFELKQKLQRILRIVLNDN